MIKRIFKYFNSCNFQHRWKYTDNGLTRECKRCGRVDHTYGNNTELRRMPGDWWQTVYGGEDD